MTIENVKCPECDGPMVSRSGKYGIFWGCKSYPKCSGTRDSMGRSKAEREAEKEDQRNELGRYSIDDDKPSTSHVKTSFNKK